MPFPEPVRETCQSATEESETSPLMSEDPSLMVCFDSTDTCSLTEELDNKPLMVPSELLIRVARSETTTSNVNTLAQPSPPPPVRLFAQCDERWNPKKPERHLRLAPEATNYT